VASFVVRDEVDLEKLQRSINKMLAPEVVAEDVRRAPEGFNARFSATAREYRYRVDMGAWPDPFEGRFVWHRQGALAVSPMREAAWALLGEHDFASFCRRPPSGGTVRRLAGFRMNSFNCVGETVVVKAEVVRKWREGPEGLLEIRVWSENSDRVSVGPGAMIVSLPVDPQ